MNFIDSELAVITSNVFLDHLYFEGTKVKQIPSRVAKHHKLFKIHTTTKVATFTRNVHASYSPRLLTYNKCSHCISVCPYNHFRPPSNSAITSLEICSECASNCAELQNQKDKNIRHIHSIYGAVLKLWGWGKTEEAAFPQ